MKKNVFAVCSVKRLNAYDYPYDRVNALRIACRESCSLYFQTGLFNIPRQSGVSQPALKQRAPDVSITAEECTAD